MTENMFDSTHQRMAKSSSNQISMYGKDFLDLVMEHGEINVQGGSSNRTPSNLFLNKIVYSNTVTPSKNSDLSSSHSHQINDQNNLQFSQYNKSYNKVEAEECNNSQAPKKLEYLEKCDKKPAKLNNFSNFLAPKVFLKSTQPTKKGSNCVTEFEDHQTSLNANKSNKHVSLVSRSDENCSLYNEPLMPSSPVCSIEASNDPNFCIKKHEDSYESTYSSDNNEEKKPSKSVKRGRNVKSHNLYEKKGRDKMNKKMRILKELIPNCNKVDKASLLDDAIEYLKNLKLQLQIMSMSNGLCIPQMMLTQLSGSGMGLNPIPSTGLNPWSIPLFSIPPLSSIKDKNKLENMFGTFSNQMPQISIPHHAPNIFFPIIIGNNSSTQLLPTTLEKPNFMDS